MDWSSSVSGAISGGFGLIGSALNYHFNKKLQEQQNEYNLNMWNLQNEYNSPAAQMRRYEEAGLNPALMYGQVTPGNAASAPVQGVPKAPDLSHDMRELAKAFNIEGLKQAIADTKVKQANAKVAGIEARKAFDEYDAQIALGHNYQFDPRTGMFVYSPYGDSVKDIDTATGRYYMLKYLGDNFRYNSLLVPRAGLIGSQTHLNAGRSSLIPAQNWILQRRSEMYGPQLRMLNYQAKYFPWTFWIGNTKQGVQTIAPFLP